MNEMISFKVSVDRFEEGYKRLNLLLDGQSWTFETSIAPIAALRLGQALYKVALENGATVGAVDPDIDGAE